MKKELTIRTKSKFSMEVGFHIMGRHAYAEREGEVSYAGIDKDGRRVRISPARLLKLPECYSIDTDIGASN